MDAVYRPCRREVGVLFEAVDDELLIFDSEVQRAHSLNSCAARVWRACDGSRSVSELAVECEVDEATALLALERLRDVNLLEQTEIEIQLPGRSAESDGVSRRVMLRQSVLAGAGVGLAIPVIRSIAAPSIAMASSTAKNPKNNTGGTGGLHCTSNGQCSTGSICSGSTHVCRRPSGAQCFHGTSSANTSHCQLGHGTGLTDSCPAAGTCTP